jgi:signal transduction histidine kinase
MTIIAHDLRSPFNVILGFSDLLADCLMMGDTGKARQYCKIIRDSSEQSMALMVNLLKWAKTQNNGIGCIPEIISAENLVREIVRFMNFQAHTKKLVFSCHIEANLDIYCDRNMMRTVLINLLSNAIKFSETGSEVTLSISTHKNNVLFTVKDTGIGIEKEKLDRLFFIEKQFSITGTRKDEGTGLGLLLCLDFVEKHNGRIWAESEPGKGSTFHFTIPAINISLKK